MSDVKNLYTLKQPVTKKFHVDGENNIDENCIDVGFQIFSIGAFEQYFKPLDVESLTTQLETKFEDAIDCGYLLGKAETAKVRTLDQLVEAQKIRIQQLTAEVLELIGITTKDENNGN